MASWFPRTDGDNRNSGGGNSAGPDINGDAGTPFAVASGVLTYAPGGLTALPPDSATYTRSVNLDVAGVRTVKRLTVLTDTTATIVGGGVGDGSYNGRIGGARDSVKKVAGRDAGDNAAVATDDAVFGDGGTYFEDAISNAAGVRLFDVVLDGTGGTTTIWSTAVAQAVKLFNVTMQNAVGNGLFGMQGAQCHASLFLNNGSHGAQALAGSQVYSYCSARGNGGYGLDINHFSPAGVIYHCSSEDNVNSGYHFFRGGIISHCLASNNGGAGGIEANSDHFSGYRYIRNCTSSDNDGDGVSMTGGGAGYPYQVRNCILSGNGGYGIDAAVAPPAGFADIDRNLYFGNTLGARNNFDAGDNDVAADPEFVDGAGGDYTLKVSSPAQGTGYSPFSSPMKANIGAVPHEVQTAPVRVLAPAAQEIL